MLLQAFSLDLLTPLTPFSGSGKCVWKACVHTESLCPETTEEANTKMKAGLDRSETRLGVGSCLLWWEEQVGRSSLDCVWAISVYLLWIPHSSLAELLYDNLGDVNLQFLLFQAAVKALVFSCLFSLLITATGISSHVESILFTAFESKVLVITEQV